MLLIVDSRCKEQGINRPCSCAVAKAQTPEPVYNNRLAIKTFQKALEVPFFRIKGGNLSASEIANQQIFAELAEI